MTRRPAWQSRFRIHRQRRAPAPALQTRTGGLKTDGDLLHVFRVALKCRAQPADTRSTFTSIRRINSLSMNMAGKRLPSCDHITGTKKYHGCFSCFTHLFDKPCRVLHAASPGRPCARDNVGDGAVTQRRRIAVANAYERSRAPDTAPGPAPEAPHSGSGTGKRSVPGATGFPEAHRRRAKEGVQFKFTVGGRQGDRRVVGDHLHRRLHRHLRDNGLYFRA